MKSDLENNNIQGSDFLTTFNTFTILLKFVPKLEHFRKKRVNLSYEDKQVHWWFFSRTCTITLEIVVLYHFSAECFEIYTEREQ